LGCRQAGGNSVDLAMLGAAQPLAIPPMTIDRVVKVEKQVWAERLGIWQ
jgi:hypothetical protein